MKQNKRYFVLEKDKFIEEHVQVMLKAGHIRVEIPDLAIKHSSCPEIYLEMEDMCRLSRPEQRFPYGFLSSLLH